MNNQLGIRTESRVGGKQSQRFGNRLCDQNPVERIAMVKRQGCHQSGVLRLNGQGKKAAALDVIQHIINRYAEFSNSNLDRRFPD